MPGVEVGRRLDILVPKQLLYDLEAAGRGIGATLALT
jgi:hypothetical protein